MRLSAHCGSVELYHSPSFGRKRRTQAAIFHRLVQISPWRYSKRRQGQRRTLGDDDMNNFPLRLMNLRHSLTHSQRLPRRARSSGRAITEFDID